MDVGKSGIRKILMERDGMSAAEANELISICQEEINEIINDSCSLMDVEEVISDNLGLEPDFVMDFIGA